VIRRDTSSRAVDFFSIARARVYVRRRRELREIESSSKSWFRVLVGFESLWDVFEMSIRPHFFYCTYTSFRVSLYICVCLSVALSSHRKTKNCSRKRGGLLLAFACVCVLVCVERERVGNLLFPTSRRFLSVARVCKCPPIIEKRI
jgi:hypothetical protein